ncbi:N-acetylglucosamine transport system permease protein [Streptacidiphilus sp. MAP12-20]|uniref:carbohydrate ABC transporter permease n=1 Tax=Streptacidiphilus sp. MAP12-20 TaxID=3156299 RepID=UPI00351180A9
MQHGRFRIITLFLAGPLALYGVFVLSPFAQAFWLSLTSWSGYTAAQPFVGLANYKALMSDPAFWQALEHNGLLLAVVPVATIILGLFFAGVLNVGASAGRVGGVRGSSVYQKLYFLPHVLPVVIVAVLWQFLYNPQLGLVNSGLDRLGLGSLKQTWLGDPAVALWSLAAIMLWTGTGFYVVLFSAAMQSIPRELYEAADLDGAGRLGTMWRITLPLLRETVQVSWIYLGIGALDAFALFQVLLPDGGPNDSTNVVSQYLYQTAFQNGQMGYASAIGVVLCLLTLLLAGATFLLSRRETIEF